MLYRVKDRVQRWRFERACSGILRTSPAEVDPDSGMVILTQLQHKDVLMFLLALKSFAKRVRPAAVYVVDDGSLSADDRSLLGDHAPKLMVLSLDAFRTPACPTGGCWERLLAIAALVRDHYVIQLDSDTLTIGAIDEVRQAVDQSCAFALNSGVVKQIVETMRERCDTAKKFVGGANAHIQVLAEANFDKLQRFESLRYVRGCAAFTGFPRRSFARDSVEEISSQMRAAIGERWERWGSEQVMSNIVVANAPGASVLPHPKYTDCNKMRAGETRFIHFMGDCRFVAGEYARLGAQVIATL